MTSVPPLLSIALGGLALLAAGCRDVLPGLPDRCTVPLVTLTPHDTTLHPGDTLTVHASFTPAAATCLPGATLADLRWHAEGTHLTVDSLTGHVTAVTVGADAVAVRAVTTTLGLGDVSITVTP
jgi:uncharacterized protein YjdB